MRWLLIDSLTIFYIISERIDPQQQQTNDKLMNGNNKAYSEMQLKSNHQQQSTISKAQSENTLNYITDGMSDLGNLQRNSSLSKSKENLVDNDSSNNFLNSERGLFSSKDQQQQPATSNGDGAAVRKLRQRNQENQGIKSDMKRYGTMEKLDVSDLVLTEGVQHSDDEDYEDIEEGSNRRNSSLRHKMTDDERERMVKSPEMFYEEDVEHFLENFHRQKPKQSPRITKLSLQHGSPLLVDSRRSGLQTINTKPRLRSTSDFSDSFLSESGDPVRRLGSISSEGKIFYLLLIFYGRLKYQIKIQGNPYIIRFL